MSPADTPATDAPAPSPEEPPTPPTPAAPPPPTPPSSHERTGDTGDAGGADRIGNLEKIVGNLAESFTAFVDGISSGNPTEDQPQKVPWTHWRGKKRNA